MEKLTKEYLDDHMNGIQSFDSFGRNLAQMVLEAASSKIEKGHAVESISIDVKFHLSPVPAHGCLWLVAHGVDGAPGCALHVPSNSVFNKV